MTPYEAWLARNGGTWTGRAGTNAPAVPAQQGQFGLGGVLERPLTIASMMQQPQGGMAPLMSSPIPQQQQFGLGGVLRGPLTALSAMQQQSPQDSASSIPSNVGQMMNFNPASFGAMAQPAASAIMKLLQILHGMGRI